MEEKKEIQKEVLKPITKVKSKEDKELQELEVISDFSSLNVLKSFSSDTIWQRFWFFNFYM